MPVPYIPNEVLLQVAEHCDLSTVSNLSLTSKVGHPALALNHKESVEPVLGYRR